MDNSSNIPNMRFEGSKDNDVYEINLSVILIVVAVLVVLGGIIFWKFSSSNKVAEVVPTPTPETVTLAPTSTPTETPTPTPEKDATPTPSAKQKVKIQVLNGTGARGDAAYLKTKLIDDGFADIETGNASETSEDAKTVVTYYGTYPASLKTGLTGLLNELYASVSAQTSTENADGKYDAVIVTGKKK